MLFFIKYFLLKVSPARELYISKMTLLRSLIKKLYFVVNYHLCWKQANYRDSKSDTDNDIWTSCILDIENSCQQRKIRVLRHALDNMKLKKNIVHVVHLSIVSLDIFDISGRNRVGEWVLFY